MMKRKINVKKLTTFFLVFMMLISLFIPKDKVLADSKSVNVDITDFKITNSQGEIPPDGYFSNTLFKLNYKWDASKHEDKLRDGDYFEFDLPDQFKFPPESLYCNFKIFAPNGEVMANALITPKEPGGGKIKVTFTSYVNNKFDIKGDMYLIARWNTTTYPIVQEGEYEIAVSSFKEKLKLKPELPTPFNTETLHKWSGQTLTEEGNARWAIRVNSKRDKLDNVIIKDTLSVQDPGSPEGIEYVPGKFILYELILYEDKFVEKHLRDVSNEVVISADKKSFTFNMGHIEQGYVLRYESTYKPGLVLKNKAELTSTQTGKVKLGQFLNAESGGGGQGDLTSKIKIVKVDKDDSEIKLKNAKFKITRKETGANFEVETDMNGEAVSMQLIPGKYSIKEIKAPTNYILEDKEYLVDVTSDKVALQQIENEAQKTKVKVKKEWIGKEGSTITAILKADGKEVAREKLSKTNSWTYTFENLKKYNPKTHTLIDYTVEEIVPQGYEVSYEKDSTGTLIIKNKVSDIVIKAKKVWVDNEFGGNKKDLYFCLKNNENIIIDSKKKVGGTGEVSWTVPKYDTAGNIINYTVVEVDKDGNPWSDENWSTEIKGNKEDGFVFTNTYNNNHISIEGLKTWDDAQDQDGKRPTKITVILLADGNLFKEVDVTPDLTGKWKYSFKNLPKYKNGKVINYQIKEKPVEGYTTIVNIYDITNIHKPEETEIKVTKIWEDAQDQDGKRPTSIKVQLYGNDKKVGSEVELTKDNWSYVWKKLPRREKGKDIKYQVKEVTQVEGYVTRIDESNLQDVKITNIHKPEKIKIEGLKTWVDAQDQDGKRPTEITINLLKNGKLVATKKVSKEDNWKWIFDNLDKYEEGKEITYTITEEDVEGYTSKINGYNVINSHIPGKISVQVKKVWEDKNNQNGKRPESVTIKLFADGKEVSGKILVLSDTNHWLGVFEGLDEYNEGKKIKYTIEEESAGNDYISKITGNEIEGYVVTNTRKSAPKTGDSTNITINLSLISLLGVVLIFLKKLRTNSV